MKKLIDLYPYRIVDGNPRFLILKRAKGKIYEGQWRMIGGKVIDGEKYWQAALRELKEETGYTPDKFWTIPSVNQFYEASTDTIHTIPAFAAQIPEGQNLKLNEEHTEAKWIRAENIENFILWPEQRRLIQLTNQIIISDQISEDWLITLN